MLKKLLKYDLKWGYKPLIVFYALTIFFSIVTRVLGIFEQSLILTVVSKICSGIVFSLIINILINCFIRNWARFIKNIYKDESYLTHTLPVNKNTIYLSKVLSSIITLLTSFVVIIGCLAICYLDGNTWTTLKQLLEQSAVYFDSSVSSLIIVILIALFFQSTVLMMCGFLGIIIGHKSNNLKTVKSIIFGFVINISVSLISLALLYLAGIINSDIMSVFNSMEVNSNVMKTLLMIVTILYSVYNIVIYFIGNRLLNKGVNVD